jgi:hypothetical protein
MKSILLIATNMVIVWLLLPHMTIAEERSTTAVDRSTPHEIVEADGSLRFVVPEPQIETSAKPLEMLGVEVSWLSPLPQSEAGDCDCPCDPVATHVTAAGSGELCYPQGEVVCDNQPRPDGLEGWWLYTIKPSLQYSHWGYANYFIEPPAGAALRAHQQVQVMEAMQARMALYRYDFYDEGTPCPDQLNPHGKKRLAELVRLLQCFGVNPLRIEPIPGCPELNIARRKYVLEQLVNESFAVPEEWVVIAEPEAIGISGAEALGIDQKYISSVKKGTQVTETSALGGLIQTKSYEEPAER